MKKEETEKMTREQKMRSGPIPKTIIEMAIPTIIAFLITSIYNLADTYFVSSLGTNATAAVSVNQSLDNFIMMAGSMMAVGAASYVARLLGAKREKDASETLSTAYGIAAILAIIILVLGTVFAHPLVRLLGATPTCETYSVQYARYVLLAAPFMATSFVMNQCLRAEGSALFSMIGMSFGGILNCILDPIFIMGLGLGVTGASMATAISKVVSWCILMTPYLKRKSLLHLTIRNFRPHAKMLKEVISIGSSSMFRSLLAIVSAIVLNRIAGGISDSVLAGIGVTTKIMMFPFSIILGFGTGFQPVAGFNWGAKQYGRVRESYRFAWKTAVFGAAVMALVVGIFANQIIGLFTETDAEMMRIGALAIRLQCVALPIHSWVCMVNMFCGGLGLAGGALALATSRQGSCFFPIVFVLPAIWGASGIAAVQGLADVLSMFLAIPIILMTFRKIAAASGSGRDVV